MGEVFPFHRLLERAIPDAQERVLMSVNLGGFRALRARNIVVNAAF
jgi:hypothetical protein